MLNQILSVARRGTRIVVVGVLQNGTDVPLLPDFVQHEMQAFRYDDVCPERLPGHDLAHVESGQYGRKAS